MIEHFGTTDNYNTEYTEWLHIPYAKDAFEATNGKDEYSQMTVWVERKEKILKHNRFHWHILKINLQLQSLCLKPHQY